jgi:hypothetical protein
MRNPLHLAPGRVSPIEDCYDEESGPDAPVVELRFQTADDFCVSGLPEPLAEGCPTLSWFYRGRAL